MELEKISQHSAYESAEEMQPALEKIKDIEMAKEPPKGGVREHMKRTLYWVHYAIFLVVIGVSIYSIIAGSIQHQHEDAKKEHDAKVSNVLQGLYKLMQMVNHLPNFGPVGINADPLDDISRNLGLLLDGKRGNSSFEAT